MNGIENMKTPIASFSISIHAVKDATWQGTIACGEKKMAFASELQLLKLMMELAPELKPDISWSA